MSSEVVNDKRDLYKKMYVKYIIPVLVLISYLTLCFSIYKDIGFDVVGVVFALVAIPIFFKIHGYLSAYVNPYDVMPGRLVSSSEGKDAFIIEEGIKPVCDVLNSIPGVKTLWSCEGHPDRPSRPYVSFQSSQAFAHKVHRLLGAVQETGTGRANAKLKYNWWLVAHFNDAGELRYTIEPNDYRIQLQRRFFLFGSQWNKAEMNAELLRMADLLKTLKD